MSRGLVLSTFTGLGALDRAFTEAGWCCVSAGDVAYGSWFDVRDFHPPAGVFDGVIGGPPCQAFSSLANLVRAKGLTPRFGNLIPEYERVVAEAAPRWFLMENVRQAPEPKPLGYAIHSFLLAHEALDGGDGFGQEQMRTRRFTFGVRIELDPVTREASGAVDLRRWIKLAALELASAPQAQLADSRAVPVKLGGSGRVKRTAVAANDGHGDMLGDKGYREARRLRAAPVTGRNEGRVGSPEKSYAPPRRTLAECMELQGLPTDTNEKGRLVFWRHSPLTVQGKRRLVGNAVPLAMGRAVAQAVVRALGE